MTTVPGVVRTYRKKPDSTIFYDVDFRSEDPGGFTPQLEADETLASYTLDVSPPGSITVIDDADQTGIENESKVVRIWTSGGTIGAIVIITVSIVTSGSVAKNFPARTYSRSIAILIAGVPVGLVDSNCCLPDEGDEGDVLTVVSGEWTSAPPIPGGLSAPEGGDDYKVAYGLSGDLEYADDVRVSSDQSSVLFGDNPSTVGNVGVSPIGTAFGGTTVIGARIDDLSQSAPLMRWNAFAANALAFGDGTYTSQARHYVRTGGFFGIYVVSTLEYSLDATKSDWQGNAFENASYIAQPGTFASSGWIRGAATSEWRGKNTGAGDSRVAIWEGADLSIGDFNWSGANRLYLDAGATGVHVFRHQGANYVELGNANGWLYAHRTQANGGRVIASGRNEANSNTRQLIRWNANVANELTLGNTADVSVWVHVLTTGTFGVWNGVVQMFAVTRDRIFVANSNAPPASPPVGGGYYYEDGGAMFHHGSGDTITTVAPS